VLSCIAFSSTKPYRFDRQRADIGSVGAVLHELPWTTTTSRQVSFFRCSGSLWSVYFGGAGAGAGAAAGGGGAGGAGVDAGAASGDPPSGFGGGIGARGWGARARAQRGPR